VTKNYSVSEVVEFEIIIFLGALLFCACCCGGQLHVLSASFGGLAEQ
jgi:hypothetical protein